MVKNEPVPESVATGIAGLDEIFLGGVKKNNIVLVEGAPGTGKTTLGLEFIYRGAKDFNEGGLIVSFELSPQKLMRDASGFGWDFESLEQQNKVKIIYTTPTVILNELQSPDGVLADQIRKLDARRILIDGLTPLRLFGELINGRPFRDSLHLLIESLQRFGITAILTNEIPPSPRGIPESHGHERFVCDTIITLSTADHRRSRQRNLEIAKSRGQDFITGQHTFRIVPGKGVEVYRRTQSRPKAFVQQPTSRKIISSGNPSLDRIMGGGIYEGSVSLAVGLSGSGKTVAGIQFLSAGVAKGEVGLFVTLDEHPQQLIRNAETLGFPMSQNLEKGILHIHYDSPLELELDVHFDEIVRKIENLKVKRVVIDSLAAYEAARPDESKDFAYALATYFKNKLITAIFNYESPELLGVSQISDDLKASHLVDNIILLNYVEISTRLRRAITVPKARGMNNIKTTREFVIGQGGISFLDESSGEAKHFDEVPQLPFSSYYGLLARSPARVSPVIEETIVSGEELPKSPKLQKD